MIFSNYEDVSYRDERLKKCARLIAAILGLTETQVSALIARLHDHKGTLVVAWIHEPSKKARLAVESAWYECSETEVVHNHPGHSNRNFEDIVA